MCSWLNGARAYRRRFNFRGFSAHMHSLSEREGNPAIPFFGIVNVTWLVRETISGAEKVNCTRR